MKIKIPQEIEITKRHIGIIAVIALLCIGYAVIDTETLTLHAYYPSPVGIYTRLVSINRAAFARDKGDVTIGANNAATRPDGRLGIGTSQPQVKLDVAGQIATSRSVIYKPLSSLPATDVKKGELVYVYNSGDDSFYHYNGAYWVKQRSGKSEGIEWKTVDLSNTEKFNIQCQYYWLTPGNQPGEQRANSAVEIQPSFIWNNANHCVFYNHKTAMSNTWMSYAPLVDVLGLYESCPPGAEGIALP